MSAELSYKDLEQKVEYQDMYIEQLHHVISELKRDRFGKKLEGFEILPMHLQMAISWFFR